MMEFEAFRVIAQIAAAFAGFIGAKLAVGAGLFSAYAPNIYHLGLIWLLGVSIFFFAQVMMNDKNET